MATARNAEALVEMGEALTKLADRLGEKPARGYANQAAQAFLARLRRGHPSSWLPGVAKAVQQLAPRLDEKQGLEAADWAAVALARAVSQGEMRGEALNRALESLPTLSLLAALE